MMQNLGQGRGIEEVVPRIGDLLVPKSSHVAYKDISKDK